MLQHHCPKSCSPLYKPFSVPHSTQLPMKPCKLCPPLFIFSIASPALTSCADFGGIAPLAVPNSVLPCKKCFKAVAPLYSSVLMLVPNLFGDRTCSIVTLSLRSWEVYYINQFVFPTATVDSFNLQRRFLNRELIKLSKCLLK